VILPLSQRRKSGVQCSYSKLSTPPAEAREEELEGVYLNAERNSEEEVTAPGRVPCATEVKRGAVKL